MEQGNMVENSGVISMPGEGNGAAADTPSGRQDDTQAGADEAAHAADLAQGDADGGEGEVSPTVLNEQADAAPARTYTQADFDAAVRRKIELASRDMRGKLENDPYYVLGKRITEEGVRMNTGNIQEAVSGLVQQGSEWGQNMRQPISAAVEQAAASMPLPTAAQRELNDKPAVARIGKELFQSMLDGDVPQNLNVADYVKVYPQFLSDCTRFGVKAALSTVNALRGVQETQRSALQKAARNNALPDSLRPAFNQMATGETDYRAMSDAEYLKVKEKMKQAHLMGKKTLL